MFWICIFSFYMTSYSKNGYLLRMLCLFLLIIAWFRFTQSRFCRSNQDPVFKIWSDLKLNSHTIFVHIDTYHKLYIAIPSLITDYNLHRYSLWGKTWGINQFQGESSSFWFSLNWFIPHVFPQSEYLCK